MQLVFDPITLVNLILCFLIVFFCIIGYTKIRTKTLLVIGVAFSLFGVSHAATLLDVRTLEPLMIGIRAAGYIAVSIGIFQLVREISHRIKTEEELRAGRIALEQSVDERTKELVASNKELRDSEEMLRESEEKYRTLVEKAEEAIIIVQDGLFVFANRRMSEILGVPVEELEGRPFIHFIWPGDRKRVISNNRRRLAGENIVDSYDFRIRGAGGRILWVFLSVAVIPWKGKPATLNLVTDITKRKEAEEALRESGARLNSIVHGSPVLQFVIDKDHRVISWNKAMEEYSGIKEPEVLGTRDQWRAFYPEQRPVLADLLADEKNDQLPAWYRGKIAPSRFVEGAYEATDFFPGMGASGKWLYFTAAPIRDARGAIIGAVETLEDITERKQAEEALLQSNRKLAMLNSITRHDLLNQLNGLRTYIELAKERENDSTMQEYLRKEAQAAEAIQWQIEFTRNYQDIGAQAPKWQELAEVLDSAMKQLKPSGIRMQIAVNGTEIFADPLIEKVFYNLMENSLRHGDHVTRIGCSVRETENGLVIAYCDNGVGIPAEDKKKLFRKGFGRHTGLGLFLSKEILSITQIAIAETGEPGAGVRFEITVPKGGYRFSKP